MKPWLKLVIAGFLIHWASNSLIQDSMGKARCLALMDSTWIPWGVTVPIALAVLVWAALIIEKFKEPQHLHFSIHHHIVIPHDMDKEQVAEIVASIKTDVAQARA